MKENEEIITEKENKTIFEDNRNNETDSNINDLECFLKNILLSYKKHKVKIKKVEMEVKDYLDSEENKTKKYEKKNEIISFLKIREKK